MVEVEVGTGGQGVVSTRPFGLAGGLWGAGRRGRVQTG